MHKAEDVFGSRLHETIASRVEAIASRLEAIASRLEAIAIRFLLLFPKTNAHTTKGLH